MGHLVCSLTLATRLTEHFCDGGNTASSSSRAGAVATDSGVGGRRPGGRAALAAHTLLQPTTGLGMQIIAGPLLPEAAWQSLHAMARGLPGLTLHRCLPDLGAALRGAVASISQCGYNTALHLVQGRVPALVVPFADGREDTQLRRARRLEHLGAVRVLDARDLNGPTLATEIRTLLHVQPRVVSLDMAGAQNTAQLVEALVQTPQIFAQSVRSTLRQQEPEISMTRSTAVKV